MTLCSSTQRHEDSCYCIICTQKRKEWLIEYNKYARWLKKTCFHEIYELLFDLWVCVKCDMIIPKINYTHSMIPAGQGLYQELLRTEHLVCSNDEGEI